MSYVPGATPLDVKAMPEFTGRELRRIANLLIPSVLWKLLNPRTEAERAAGVTPVNYAYLSGNVLRYGTNTVPGTTDMTAAFESAASVSRQVIVPAGTYSVNLAAFSGVSNLMIVGEGRGRSIIKLANGADAMTLSFVDCSDITLRDLTIDGNRANQTLTVHGIRLSGVDGFTAENVEIKECFHYGIGAQDGTITRFKLANVDIHDTGGDGIDFKNKNDDNLNNEIVNLTVRRWGLNAVQTVQAAVDVRGPMRLSNICVSEPGADDAMGLRFRQGETSDTNGFGGHRSSLAGFDIRMGAAASGLGLNVVARDVTVGQGYVNGGFRGVVVQESGFRGTAITVESASDDGFVLDAAGGGLDADDAVLVACKATDCDSGFVVETDNCQLIGCRSTGNEEGIVLTAGADNNKVIGGSLAGNSVAPVSDAGSGNTFQNVEGYVTENYVESASLALDSTGSKTAVIAHGLAAAPDPKKCSIVHIRETAVADHAIGYYQIDGVDSTNISVRAWVSAASATGGATFRLGVHVRV